MGGRMTIDLFSSITSNVTSLTVMNTESQTGSSRWRKSKNGLQQLNKHQNSFVKSRKAASKKGSVQDSKLDLLETPNLISHGTSKDRFSKIPRMYKSKLEMIAPP